MQVGADLEMAEVCGGEFLGGCGGTGGGDESGFGVGRESERVGEGVVVNVEEVGGNGVGNHLLQ